MTEEQGATEEQGTTDPHSELKTKLKDMKKKMLDATEKSEEYLEKLQRLAAEFDNYKKRATKEKEGTYVDVVASTVGALLPAIDNFDRAADVLDNTEIDGKAIDLLVDGVKMASKQMQDCLKALGVELVQCVGEKFNPELHHAVMHVSDGAHGESEIVEELQRGYIIKGKVIRHSMVKVAN